MVKGSKTSTSKNNSHKKSEDKKKNSNSTVDEKRTFRVFLWDGSKYISNDQYVLRCKEPLQAAKKATQKGAQYFALTEKIDSKNTTVYFYLGERIPTQQPNETKAVVKMWNHKSPDSNHTYWIYYHAIHHHYTIKHTHLYI